MTNAAEQRGTGERVWCVDCQDHGPMGDHWWKGHRITAPYPLNFRGHMHAAACWSNYNDPTTPMCEKNSGATP